MGKYLLLLVLNQITPANAELQVLFLFQSHSHLLGVVYFLCLGFVFFFPQVNGEVKQKAEARQK